MIQEKGRAIRMNIDNEYVMMDVDTMRMATPFKDAVGAEDGVRLTERGTFIFDPTLEITAEVIHDFIQLHKSHRLPILLENHYMYQGSHKILTKEQCLNELIQMPDNRLVVNFAKYIVDTYNGYFIGIPIKIKNEDDNVTKAIQEFIKRSDLNDNFAELSKLCAIYGNAYAYMYQGSDAKTYMTYNSPLDMFVIYDDSIEQNPLAAVRFWENQRKSESYIKAEVFIGNKRYIYDERTGPNLQEDNSYNVIYEGLPIIEFVENDDRMCVFQHVKTLINQFNSALSEKANDVEYFANAYLKILGAKVDNATMTVMQANRVINATGAGAQQVEIDFIQKPDADATAEHLLDRLMDLIFIIAMVANTTDDTYGNASGTALEFKLQDMRNMSIAKERKFTSSLREVFKLWSKVPRNVPNPEAWINNTYVFTENIPRNVKEEIENAKNLEGVVTKETQLEQLSFIDDVQGEITQMEKEAQENMEKFSSLIPMNGQQTDNNVGQSEEPEDETNEV